MAKPFPIKVCGITRVSDARLAVDLGALALGFIFYPKSPRYLAPERVRDIIQKLNAPDVLTVGVFVNADAATVRSTKEASGIKILQLHGDETPDFCASLKDLRLWKAFRLKSEEQLTEVKDFEPFVEAFLFDASVEGAYGGTGHSISDELLAKIPKSKPTLIAGGLGPDNWRDVYDKFKPWAIDLSSSVESSPGIKDPVKLSRLFKA